MCLILLPQENERGLTTDRPHSFTYHQAGYDFNSEHVDSSRSEKQVSIHASFRLLSFFQIIIWTLAVNIFYIFPTCILNAAVLKLRADFITREQLGMVRNARYVGSASLSSGFGHSLTSCEALSPSISKYSCPRGLGHYAVKVSEMQDKHNAFIHSFKQIFAECQPLNYK